MRNLGLLNRVATPTQPVGTADTCMTVDVESGTVFVATDSEVVATKKENARESSIVNIEPGDDGEQSPPVGLEYIFDQRAVCLATSDGRLCLWPYELTNQLEVVGEVSQGITAMAWSPDYELVLIATGDNKLLMMTSEFDVITEMSLFPGQKGEDSNVAVGWGKKETQFHGSAGKQAAKVEHVEVRPADNKDNRRPQISWRGDGQFFAVSVIEPDTGARCVYTWARECVFQAKSEPTDGLQHSLAWKPSGSLIAAVQTNCHKQSQDIVFFEKNGLRHGEFTIPPIANRDFNVHQILWNQDSSILALHINCYGEGNKSSVSYVLLFTVNNYHWYLKQTLKFDTGVAAVCWDPENACKLWVLAREGELVTYHWAWNTVCSASAHVAVIDGDKLLVTPLARMLVPPPMSAFTLTCPAQVNSVTFSHCPSSNDMMALLCTGQLALFGYNDSTSLPGKPSSSGDGFTRCCGEPELLWTYDIRISGCEARPTDLSHLLWVADDRVLMVTQGGTPSHSLLLMGAISHEEKAIIVSDSDQIKVDSVILDVFFYQETFTVAVELVDGKVLKFDPDSRCVSEWLTNEGERVQFPRPCSQIAVTTIASEEVVIGLTDRFRLFVNNTEIASNCTSFGIHNNFLVLTTLNHTLRCLPKSLKPNALSCETEAGRSVERGSRIVAVVPTGTQVVLQMPRGNLETIHPRPLLLDSLRRLMDEEKIQEAFLTIRKHRINMNLLYDHNPKHFLDNIENFMEAVGKTSYLNVFLTDLKEEDVTQTMYSASYRDRVSTVGGRSDTDKPSKVDAVCDAFLKSFQKLGVKKHIESVLTAYAKKSVPELEKALLLVWSLHDEDNTGAEAALKYLLFLVDVNRLYDVALGTYNFDLVMMVAHKSQKDPKEYIPFLNELRRLEDNYRYYSIDKHLKKYSKALEHLTKCGEEHFEKCITLVSDHKLHAQALRLYKPGSSQFKSLATLYGNYLLTKNRYEEAGLQFVRAEEWALGLQAFQQAGDWHQVFSMAHQMDYTPVQLAGLAVKMAGELKSRQKYMEASMVLIDYAQDYEEAIVALVEGSHWKEAIRQMQRFKRTDLVETHLLEALEESWEHHVEVLQSQSELFNKHRDRLRDVRLEKERAATQLLEGTADFNDAEADLFSDTTSLTGVSVTSRATSNSSRSTVFTKGTGSARTRRKAENKKWSLKEGSVHEEFALVDAEAKIIKAIDGMKEEISNLLKMLVQFNFDEKAQELQELYSNVLQIFQTSIPEIWTYTQKAETGTMNLGPNMTANAAAQALQRGQALHTEGEKLDPVMLAPPTINKDMRWKLHTSSDQDK